MSDIDIRTSPEIGALAEAIAKAQAELENVDKTGSNPAFKADGKAAKYVKLGAVLDAVRPIFAKHGIAVVQMPVNGEGSNVGIVTLLAHSGGQWIESRMYVAPMKFDAQGAGSAITYLRRYSLMAMAGVAPDDDDGNAAVARPEGTAAPSRARAPAEQASSPFDDSPNGAGRPAGERAAAPPSLPPTNGKAAPAPSADDPERKTKHDRAVAVRDRIKAAIEKAKEPVIVDEILRVNRVDMEFILAFHEPTYNALLALAAARSTELLASA
jgi:hypothetical protein